MTNNFKRYADGETLEGDAARNMLEFVEQHPWRFWARLAWAYLRYVVVAALAKVHAREE